MDGLEKMVEQIEEKAKQERESILKEAKEKADEKKNEGKKKAEEEKKRIIEKGKEEADRIRRRTLASARRKGRQEKLEAREKVIQEVLEDVEKELSNLRKNDERYENILKNLIEAGGVAVGGGNLEVLLSERDEDVLSNGIKSELSEKVSERTENETSLEIIPNLQNTKGGTIVQRKDGSISCNNTFEARLERLKRSLRPKIAEILFKGEG